MAAGQARHLKSALLALVLACVAGGASALDRVRLVIPPGTPNLADDLSAASRLAALAEQDEDAGADEILAAALSDYADLTRVLYAQGRYGGTVNIRLDGREAAQLSLINTPRTFDTVEIQVDPGPVYRFGNVRMGPLPPAQPVSLPAGGTPARASEVREAVDGIVTGWRTLGHAYAAPDGQDVVADHATDELDLTVGIDPGPRVTLGAYDIPTPSAVREGAIRRIAGAPEGLTFSPEILAQAEQRLRRTGAFRSVAITEPDTLGPDGRMSPELRVVDEKPRRFGFGAEIASAQGVTVSAFWLHRNFLGGAERFRIEGEIADIGGTQSGTDYSLASRLDIPAIYGAETGGFVMAEIERKAEPTFTTTRAELGFGITRRITDNLNSEIALTYLWSEVTNPRGRQTYNLLTLPAELEWDRRDDPLDPTSGFYVRAEARPFLGLGNSSSGARVAADARVYQSLGESTVIAGRFQAGTVAGPTAQNTYPEFLFYSGGGGTVRGQPYQSLDAAYGGGQRGGGQSFAGASLELRQSITDSFQAVGFFDYGYVTTNAGFSGASGSHSGAGIGIRYKTPVGPIRFDVAVPVSGNTGNGVQFYLGIGQSF